MVSVMLSHAMEGLPAVMLGDCGGEFRKALKPHDSFVGGRPLWLGLAPPSPSATRCPTCKSQLSLVAQLYAPFDNAQLRVLYILGCNSSCGCAATGWVALRTSVPWHPDPADESPAAAAQPGSDWGAAATAAVAAAAPFASEWGAVAPAADWGTPAAAPFATDWGAASTQPAAVSMDDQIAALLESRGKKPAGVPPRASLLLTVPL